MPEQRRSQLFWGRFFYTSTGVDYIIFFNVYVLVYCICIHNKYVKEQKYKCMEGDFYGREID